jgi:hypothetical protein
MFTFHGLRDASDQMATNARRRGLGLCVQTLGRATKQARHLARTRRDGA